MNQGDQGDQGSKGDKRKAAASVPPSPTNSRRTSRGIRCCGERHTTSGDSPRTTNGSR